MPVEAGGELTMLGLQTEFDVLLKECGPNKFYVLKVVIGLTGLRVREAKEIIDHVPSLVVSGVSQKLAKEAQALLEDGGAVADIR